MTRQDNEQTVRKFFDEAKPRIIRLARELVEDAEDVVEDASELFNAMIPDMVYVDDPHKQMANSVFACSVQLALYLALQKRGVDVHDFGRVMLERMANAPAEPDERPKQDSASRRRAFQQFIDAGEASQREPRPGEFVFEAFPGERPGEWGMNIKSCAICHQFSKYDAMDLVPYMCATDDVQSDREGQGLRRHGTIALGAHQCDFRYARGGEPLRVAEQYPDRIRVVQK
jgi:DNA-directed RNA polymerase specialized sigma24 family protein